MIPRLRLIVIAICGLVAISSSSLLIRLALSAGVSPINIGAFRLSLAFLILSVPVVYRQTWRDYAKLTFRSTTLATASGLLLALHFATWISSLSHTTILSSVVLVSSAPIWIGLASPIFLGEIPPALSWVGVVIAIVGGGLLGLADMGGKETDVGVGDLLALLGAVCAAGYLMIGRRFREVISLTAYTWLVYGVAAACLAVWAFAASQPLVGFAFLTYVWLVILSIVPQLIGHTAANYLVRHLPATQVGVYMLGESVGSTLLGIALIHEMPRPMQLIGGATILVGIGISTIAWQLKSQPAALTVEK